MWLWKQKSSVTLNFSSSINVKLSCTRVSIPCHLFFHSYIQIIKKPTRIVCDLFIKSTGTDMFYLCLMQMWTLKGASYVGQL